MFEKISKLLDRVSGFFSQRKGLLPLIGIGLILVNFIFRLTISGWLIQSDLFLHAGIVVAILGFLLAWAL